MSRLDLLPREPSACETGAVGAGTVRNAGPFKAFVDDILSISANTLAWMKPPTVVFICTPVASQVAHFFSLFKWESIGISQ
jgi:hypothetical protein